MKKITIFLSALLFFSSTGFLNLSSMNVPKVKISEKALRRAIDRSLMLREVLKFSIGDLYDCVKSVLSDYGIRQGYDFWDFFLNQAENKFDVEFDHYYDYHNNDVQFYDTEDLRIFLFNEIFQILKLAKNYDHYYRSDDLEGFYENSPLVQKSPKQKKKKAIYRTDRAKKKNKQKKVKMREFDEYSDEYEEF